MEAGCLLVLLHHPLNPGALFDSREDNSATQSTIYATAVGREGSDGEVTAGFLQVN